MTAAAAPATSPPKVRRSTSKPASSTIQVSASSALARLTSRGAASGRPSMAGSSASRGITTVLANRSSSRMSKRVSRWPFSIKLTVLCDQPRSCASSSWDSPVAARKMTIMAARSSPASARRMGGESHNHTGVKPPPSAGVSAPSGP